MFFFAVLRLHFSLLCDRFPAIGCGAEKVRDPQKKNNKIHRGGKIEMKTNTAHQNGVLRKIFGMDKFKSDSVLIGRSRGINLFFRYCFGLTCCYSKMVLVVVSY